MNALNRMTSALSATFAVAIIFALAVPSNTGAHAGPQSSPPTAAEVKIGNFTFGPTSMTVAPGTTVTWTNGDDIPHTVVSTDKVFKSKALDTGDKFTFTFTKPGKYPYYCSIHPEMTGEVVVQ
jgi:plastocyanin